MKPGLVPLLFFAFSCSAGGSRKSGSDSAAAADFSAFHGIYAVNAHTWNQTGCDAEGDAVAEGDAFMVLYTARYYHFAVVGSCSDVAACRDQSTSDRPRPMGGADFAADFDRITAEPQGLTGTSFGHAGTETAYVTDNLLTKSGDNVHIEMRTRVLDCVVREKACDESASIVAAATVPCRDLRVVSATFAQGL